MSAARGTRRPWRGPAETRQPAGADDRSTTSFRHR